MWLQERTHKKFLSKCLVYLSAFIKVPTEILPPRAKPEIHANSTPGFSLTANLFQQRSVKRYFSYFHRWCDSSLVPSQRDGSNDR